MYSLIYFIVLTVVIKKNEILKKPKFFTKPLAKAKHVHMVKTVRNMFDKKQKVPFQSLTPDMMGTNT